MRTKQLWVAVGKLSPVMKNKNISLDLKDEVFNMCILPVCVMEWRTGP